MNRRLLLFGLLALLLLGSLGISGGYAWYWRSEAYRQRCAAALSARLELPADIGRVVPRSRRTREFQDVIVWLPGRRGRALTCRSALLIWTPTPEQPTAYELELAGGTCEISKRTWLSQDYRGVVESGLRPGFAPDGPRRVSLHDMSLTFRRDRFQAEFRGTGGYVSFENPRLGHAAVTCNVLNGYRCPQPVLLTAEFSPNPDGIRIDRLELTVPELPVEVVGLRELAGVAVRSGSFRGQLTYQETDGQQVLVVNGRCAELELLECTAGLTPRPLRGACPQAELLELRLENWRPVRLRFRGTLRDVALGDLLAIWGLEGVRGQVTLDVGAADLSPTGIERLVTSGSARDIALQPLTSALGWGTMTGRLNLTIADLTIEDNRLRSLDATAIVAGALDQPNWIEGRLLHELLRRSLKLDLPRFLPERIEYTRLGFRLQVRDEVLYIFGTHGERNEAILTVRLAGRDLPVLFEPKRAFDLRFWFDRLRARAAEQLRERLTTWSEGSGP